MPRLREFRFDAWAEWAWEQYIASPPDVLAIDTETTGIGFYDTPFAATLTWRGRKGRLISAYFDLEAAHTAKRIKTLKRMLQLAPAWVFHNAKFDLQKLRLIGALPDPEPHELHDTQTLYVLINENGRKGLKHLATTVLGIEEYICVEVKSGPNKGTYKRVPKEEHALGVARRKLKLKKEDGYHLLPRDVLIPYALRDTEFTLLLYERLMPQLEGLGDARLLKLYRSFMELKIVLLEMEADGFRLDLEYLNEATSEYGVKVMEGWDEIVKLTKKPDLNPQSPAQLIEVFAERGLNLESTAEAVLTELDDDLARALIQYRSDKKTHTTYLTALQSEHRDGLIHPNFNDDAARTGRMSSSAASNN